MVLVPVRGMGRDVTAIGRQEIAGKDFNCRKEQQKHRRKAKRLGPNTHASLFCHNQKRRVC